MAELYAGGHAQSGPASGKSFGTFANWIGAAISVALIIGVAVWGYRLLVRDVSGVPVVRAAEGPMRIQPQEPGGQPAAHQGLAVNSVAADGSAEAPADRLVLAPRPVALADEDGTRAQLGLVAPSRDTAPVAPVTDQSMAEAEEPRQDTPIQRTASVQSLVDQLTAGAKPLGANAPAPAPGIKTSLSATVDSPVAAPKAGLARSLRPRMRPADVGQRVASIAPVAPVAASARDVDATTVPTGTRLAQLGAFDSPDVAKREWQRLEARFGDYMAGKSRVIQKAQSGGRTFYRLRAMGFADLNDARRFCAAFVAERADCIPVVTR